MCRYALFCKGRAARIPQAVSVSATDIFAIQPGPARTASLKSIPLNSNSSNVSSYFIPFAQTFRKLVASAADQSAWRALLAFPQAAP